MESLNDSDKRFVNIAWFETEPIPSIITSSRSESTNEKNSPSKKTKREKDVTMLLATSDKKKREFLIFRQLNNGTKIDSPSRFLPAFRFRSIETVEFFAEEYSINLAGYYDRREGWEDSIRDGMEAAIFHGGPGCQRFEFAGSSIKSTSVGARDAFSLSLSHLFSQLEMSLHLFQSVTNSSAICDPPSYIVIVELWKFVFEKTRKVKIKRERNLNF